jgi:hypothetical protein
MGREAVVPIEVGRVSGEAHVLLESQELIVRGELRRRITKADMTSVKVDGDWLCFKHNGEQIKLGLGGKTAKAWADSIAKPPPSLRAKLGLDKGGRAFVAGTVDDTELAAALNGVTTSDAQSASMIIVRINSAADLKAAVAAHKHLAALPFWTIYPKGKGVSFGDTAIREALRALGYRDSKSCAVSETLTATRYGRS